MQPSHPSHPVPDTGPDVIIHVNEKPVVIHGPRVTGLEIKQVAIAAGVNLQVDFVLSEERPDGTAKIVGDRDTVTVNKNSRFVAVAPDDNS